MRDKCAGEKFAGILPETERDYYLFFCFQLDRFRLVAKVASARP